MPEGIPARLPALLWLAIEHGWDVRIRTFGGVLREVWFWRNPGEDVEVVWELRGTSWRLASCELLGKPRGDGYREPSKRMLLRDVPSILRGAP